MSTKSLLPARSGRSLDLSVRNAPRLVTIPVGKDHEINVVYKTANITPAALNRLSEVARTGKKGKANPDATEEEVTESADHLFGATQRMIDLIVDSVVEWDLCNDGKPVPLTSEALQDVDVELLGLVVGGLQGDNKPSPTNPTASASG